MAEVARIEVVLLADGSVTSKFGCRLPAPSVVLCGMLEVAKSQVQEKLNEAGKVAVAPAPPGFASNVGVKT